MSSSELLVGIGSPHGDDCVGWEIARRLSERLGSGLVVRCARTPAELLDWLEEVDTLDICDAVSSGEAGSIYCWQWPTPEIERVPFRGSHDLSLPAVLALAEGLGRLPAHVRIWGVAIKPGRVMESLSADAAAAVTTAVDRICGALVHA